MIAARRGGSLTIVGPDGSGKTTLCEALDEGALGGPVLRVHHRFGLLPASGRPADTSRPHAVPPYGRLASEAKAVYLFVDYVLGWLRRARPHIRRGGWVILERGWWDLVVDHRRYRLHPRTLLPALLGRLLFQTDLVVVLEVPLEAMLARKSELDADELVRQSRAWHVVLPPRARRIWVDGRAEVVDIVGTVTRAVHGGPARQRRPRGHQSDSDPRRRDGRCETTGR